MSHNRFVPFYPTPETDLLAQAEYEQVMRDVISEQIGDKAIPCTATIEYIYDDTPYDRFDMKRLNDALRCCIDGKISIQGGYALSSVNFPFSLFSDEMLATFEYYNGISYSRWARSKRAYWTALYQMRGTRYPRKKKINQKRLAIVRRKTAKEQSVMLALPKIAGATSYKIYGIGLKPITIKVK